MFYSNCEPSSHIISLFYSLVFGVLQDPDPSPVSALILLNNHLLKWTFSTIFTIVQSAWTWIQILDQIIAEIWLIVVRPLSTAVCLIIVILKEYLETIQNTQKNLHRHQNLITSSMGLCLTPAELLPITVREFLSNSAGEQTGWQPPNFDGGNQSSLMPVLMMYRIGCWAAEWYLFVW